MYKIYDIANTFKPEEILVYLRKSQSDDPLMTVEEVLARHEKDLDEWAIAHLGDVVPERNKYREVVSGESIIGRSEMLKLLKRIEDKNIKGVLIKECSRLGRPDLEEIGRLTKIFRYTNTLVITPQMIFDLDEEFARKSFESEMMQSANYLDYYKKIQRAGLERSAADGWYLGSKPPYGYERIKVQDGKKQRPTLKEIPEEANVVRMIFDMYVNQGIGRTNICHYLDSMNIKPAKGEFWSPHSIKSMLTNVHYIGKIKRYERKQIIVIEDGEFKKKAPRQKPGEFLIYEGRHTGIIDEETFNKAQDIIGKNHRAKANTKVRNPLAGLIWCRCGRAMSLRTYKNKDGSERNAPRLLCDGQVHCGSGSVLYEEMLEKVRGILESAIEDFEIKFANNDGNTEKLHKQMIQNLEKKIKDLRARELSQWEAQSDPDPSKRMPQEIFKELNEKLLKEKEETQKALKNAYENLPEPIHYEERIERFTKALNTLQNPNADAETKNRLLKDCIERIEYSRDRPERIKSQQIRYYDKEQKRTRNKSPLKTGGNWTTPPIELDVILKV